MEKRANGMIGRLFTWLRKADGALLDLLFPEGVTCLCCQRAPREKMVDGLCEACSEALDALAAQQEARSMDPCDLPENIAFVHAAFVYRDQARTLIRTLKYKRIRSAAVPLWRAMLLLPSGEEDVLLISDNGTIIRTSVGDINVYKRDTKGVHVMRTEGDSRIIAIEKVEKSEETDEAEETEVQTEE